MPDFWTHCGYHLLEQLPHDRPPGGPHGFLGVTDDFLRAYVERPEMALVEESCDAERALHKALLANPREAVAALLAAIRCAPRARSPASSRS